MFAWSSPGILPRMSGREMVSFCVKLEFHNESICHLSISRPVLWPGIQQQLQPRLCFQAYRSGRVRWKAPAGKSKVQVFDTPQVVNCFKVESDAALLPS